MDRAAEHLFPMAPLTNWQRLPERPPHVGEIVHLRSRRWLVEEVVAPARGGESSRVLLACAADDAQGQSLEVFRDYEIDRRILEEEGWSDLAARGFDPPLHRATLSALLNGNVALSPEMALRVEKAFGVSMDMLLRMQAWYGASRMRARASKIDVRRCEPA